MNRFQKVPCIIDKDFKLAESIAIIRYLAREYPDIPDHWYPQDSRKRAKVDEYLEWQQHNTRALCALYFQYAWLRPLMGIQVKPESLENMKTRMENCLDFIENEWLGKGNKYIVGDEISVADLFAACEIEQPS